MKLFEIIKRPFDISTLGMPDLIYLKNASQKITNKWRDIVPKPIESDHEKIIAEMVDRIRYNKWDNCTISSALRAFRVAYEAKYWQWDDAELIRQLALSEIENTASRTFINSMVGIYASTYHRGAETTAVLGAALFSRIDMLSTNYKKLVTSFPQFFNADDACQTIASKITNEDRPWHYLEQNGFKNHKATGLLDEVHRQFVLQLGPNLDQPETLKRLLRWLKPEPSKKRTTSSALVIEMILTPWLEREPNEHIREMITESLCDLYGDPRTTQTHWLEVRQKYQDLFMRWLTREDLAFFISVVDSAHPHPMWDKRKEFWLDLYEKKLIEAAWVAFSPNAAKEARKSLQRSEENISLRQFAMQTGRPNQDTSILIMKIGNKIMVEGTHNYKTHVFRADDPLAPKLYKSSYDCDNDIRIIAPHSRPHSSIRGWKDWVMRAIYQQTPYVQPKG